MDPVVITQGDAVSDVLRLLSVESSIFCSSELHAPWGFTVEGSTVGKFHLVLAGSCLLRLDGREPVGLGPGDLVLLPGGDAHSLSDGNDQPSLSLDELLAESRFGDDLTLRIDGDGAITAFCVVASSSAPTCPRRPPRCYLPFCASMPPRSR